MKPSRQKLKGSGMLYGRKCRTREDIEILRARIGTHLQEELPNLSVEESVNVQEREEEFPTLHGPGLDPKVMKRLSEMAPDYVTETFLADNIDEPTSHRLRLLQRLRANGLMEMEVAADGNCQFRALSDQLYHSSENHDYVRKLILNQLKSHPELYEQYVDRDYGEYLEELSRHIENRSGSWGDNVTLHAAADVLGIKIIVVTSHPNVCYYQIDPNDGEPTRDVEEDPPDQVPIQEDASDSKDICSKHTDEAASHRQRLSASLNENEDNVKVAPAPIVTAASWKSCCALFEVLFGFKAT
ncbi:hypothetical protein C5167_014974 [Papaver somniferum]|uniref:OTU domain-containing protein n=1 Tax=Papaver somniferum TaxID=3469 RepID=A0A4Y7J8S7_PAPSO|nr:hypothetical protein C5167_014974 [Papaver somniferum]